MNKLYDAFDDMVQDIHDGATIAIGGFFSTFDAPNFLLEALRKRKVKNLTIVCNGAGTDDHGLGGLIKDGAVKKLIASFPGTPAAWAFRDKYLAGEVELELTPQGTLAERLRAGGAGIGGFYTKTGVGTEVAEGKEAREIDGVQYILEKPIIPDFSLIKAQKGDRYGNLAYKGNMLNFNMVMAMAGKVVMVEVEEVVEHGALHPEAIHTPGIFVDRMIETKETYDNPIGSKKKVEVK